MKSSTTNFYLYLRLYLTRLTIYSLIIGVLFLFINTLGGNSIHSDPITPLEGVPYIQYLNTWEHFEPLFAIILIGFFLAVFNWMYVQLTLEDRSDTFNFFIGGISSKGIGLEIGLFIMFVFFFGYELNNVFYKYPNIFINGQWGRVGNLVIAHWSLFSGIESLSKFFLILFSILGYVSTYQLVKELRITRYEYFPEGLRAICLFDKWGFINPKGEIVIDFVYHYVSCFCEGLARVGQPLGLVIEYCFINEEGKIISEWYIDAKDFSEGLAAVRRSDKWGFIDKQGKEVIKPKYSYVVSFSEGLAFVTRYDKDFLIDKDGNEYLDMTEDEARRQMKNR